MNRRLSSISGDYHFDNVLKQIGYNGKFQKRFNWLFNFLLVVLTAMTFLNIILTLAVPEHWCHVPGRENTNLTLEEWKNLTLPMDSDTRGLYSLSKCKMYNVSFVNVSQEDHVKIQESAEIVDCQYGWDFDTTYYHSTVASERNWVCDRELYATNAYAVARVGDVIGTFTFGLLSDILGRQPVYFMALTSVIMGRCMTTFVGGNYPMFLFSMFLGSIPSTAVFQSPLVIAMEISHDNDRSRIALLQCIGWTIGMCILPGIFWLLGEWFEFMLVSTLPCIGMYLFSGLMIESPRWLLSQGKFTKCIKELKKIAKVNGTSLPKDGMMNLMRTNQKDTVFGTLGLFSHWRLAKNTLLIVLCWIASSMTYYIMVLNIDSLGGNPLLNFFFQGLAELPAYILGQVFSDRFGRRWTQFVTFFIIAFTCIPLSIYAMDPKMSIVTSSLAVFIKFCTSLIYYACSLLTLEIYPTCVRQSGLSFGAICASAFVILGPYVVYLGTTFDIRYPYLIIGLMSLLAGVGSCCLPETLYAKLPQTLEDAHVFGADQKFWSMPHKPDEDDDDEIAKEKNKEFLLIK